MNSTNKIPQTLYLLLFTLLFLSIITYLIPEKVYETYDLKKIDYLTPILASKKDTFAAEKKLVAGKKTSPKTAAKKKSTISCPEGIVCIEDFSENKQHKNHFLKALNQAKSKESNCRIAFFGDSFIEGDILTSDLRDTLQELFGGKGIGFLPLSSEVSMFRRSLPSESEGWKTFVVGKDANMVPLGISGYAYQPEASAELVLHPNRNLSNIRLLYHNTGESFLVHSHINRKHTRTDTLPTAEGIQAFSLTQGKDTIRQYKMQVEGQENLTFYGLSIESGTGVYLDNFSLRGNSGTGLTAIADSQLAHFQKIMDYKLIVLQFGLNVAGPKTTDFSFYEKSMVKVIARLKRQFPASTFLLLSTSDRSSKQNGNFATIPSIPLLVDAQRRIAEQSGILFWNMYQAMGGENSMVTFVNNKPALAAKDYTHLTFPGGKKIASNLAKALLHEYRQYKKGKKNDVVQMAAN